MAATFAEVLSEGSWERNDFGPAVEEAISGGAGVDPGLSPIDPALHKMAPGLLSRGGVAPVESPDLAPSWAPRGPAGYLFADDLLTEGLELLSRGNILLARAKLECSLAVLERMPREGAVVSASGMIERLHRGVDFLRRGRHSRAEVQLAPLTPNRL